MSVDKSKSNNGNKGISAPAADKVAPPPVAAAAPVAAAGAKRGRKPAPENETKEMRFKRLAVPRVNKAIKALRAIGNLAGSAYEFDDAAIAKVFGALTAEVTAANEKFVKTAKAKVDAFSL